MTNREKFIEVFGYVPEECAFPCPKECPKEYVPSCKGCPYHNFDNAEYKEPEGVQSMDEMTMKKELLKSAEKVSNILKECRDMNNRENDYRANIVKLHSGEEMTMDEYNKKIHDLNIRWFNEVKIQSDLESKLQMHEYCLYDDIAINEWFKEV